MACSPRSGTTLLHEVMVTCFGFDKHHDHEMRFELVVAGAGEIALSKRPRDTRYMPQAIKLNGNLFVIYLMRDPRDVICSRHHQDPTRYFSNARFWREMHSFGRRMYDHPRFLEVRYEEFVRNPDATQSLIAGTFPWLEPRCSFSDYHRYAQVSEASRNAMNGVRPIAPTSVGVWRQHLPRIKAQHLIHGSLTPDLIATGYETNAEWEGLLDDVVPDWSNSTFPETRHAWSRLGDYVATQRRVAKYRRQLRNGAADP